MRKQSSILWVSRKFVWSLLVVFMECAFTTASAQNVSESTGSDATPSSQVGVPRLIQYSGVLKDGAGLPLTGAQGVMFAVYKDQEGGSPLWVETQNVQADDQGRFAVLLGAKTTDGVPVDLFSTSESRWLGARLQAPDAAEQPRVLLVSVPYALKAADAETLGGMPLSAFVLAAPADITGTQAPSTIESGKRIVSHVAAAVSGAAVSSTVTTNGGALNKLPKWDSSGTNLIDSAVLESGGNVGIGTAAPADKLEVAGNITSLNSNGGLYIYQSGNATSTNQEYVRLGYFANTVFLQSNKTGTGTIRNMQFDGPQFAFTGGNVGIGTTNPTANLTLADSATQSGNLQEWQDNSGNRMASVDPAGTFTGPLGMMLVHGSFVQATGADLGTASYTPSDTLMEAQTGTTVNSIDDTVGGVLDVTNLSRTQTLLEGLNRKGFFITARVRWNSASIVSSHVFYVLAGGAKSTSTANTPLLTSSASNGIYEGFGFEAIGTALKGITIASGTSTVVDLATTLSTGGGTGSFVEVMAVRGALSVQFYVNGTYKGCISATTLSGCTTSNSGTLPSTAASTYEVRTQNETSGTATNAIAQVGFLTVGIPRP